MRNRSSAQRKDDETMAVKITVEEEQMTARLAGEIDHHAAQQLREEIDSRAQ